MKHCLKTSKVIKTCTLFAVLILFIVACGAPKDSSSKDSESNRTIYHGKDGKVFKNILK